MRNVVRIRLSNQEQRLAQRLQLPRRGRERGVSYTLRQLLLEEGKRRGLWPPHEQAEERGG